MLFTGAVIAYGVLYIAAGYLLDKEARKALLRARGLKPSDACPPVTVIKPVCGADMYTEKCFRSWLTQKYDGPIQFIFSLQYDDDRALEVLRRLESEFKFEVIVTAVRDGYNGKTSNMFYGLQRAQHDFLIFSDADILAPNDTIQKIVAETRAGAFDLLTCIPLHADSKNIWARIYAVSWNSAVLHLGSPSILRGKAFGVAGGTVGLSKTSLQKLGGLESIRDSLAEDLQLGQNAKKAGLRIGLGPVVSSPVGTVTFQELIDRLVRAQLVAVHMNPLGRRVTVLSYLFVYGYIPISICALASGSAVALAFSALVIVARGLALGRLCAYAEGCFRFPFEFLMGDLLNIFAFFTGLLEGEVFWGGIQYRVARGGAMSRKDAKAEEEPTLIWSSAAPELPAEPDFSRARAPSAPANRDS